MSQVRVRIAPSPTGDPHVGTAYVALFNYVFAKQNGGQFILRIEDTDRARAKSSSEEIIMSSLKWLGLTWDEGPDGGGDCGPYRQSERSEIYAKHCETLLTSGDAYRCFCSPERLAKMRDEQRERGKSGYDRHCLSLSSSELQKNLDEQVPFVVRLKMPRNGETVFTDKLRGELKFANEQIDDQVLLKSDGFPTYHLANVVDDHLMAVSHVIRAEEWISSTPKHVQLYKAFGWQEPEWVHLPLLRNTDKSKISKRKNPVSLNYYKRAGYLPAALLNFLALLGWNPGNDQEIFSLADMKEKFDLRKINLGDPVFDITKLKWMNQQYLQKLSAAEFSAGLMGELFSETYLQKIHQFSGERIHCFEEVVDKFGFFFNGELNYDGLEILPKNLEKKVFIKAMKDLAESLDELYDWNKENLEGLINDHKNKLGWKPKDFFMPLRLLVTGRKDSPPLMETLEVLGREIVRFRLRDGIKRAI